MRVQWFLPLAAAAVCGWPAGAWAQMPVTTGFPAITAGSIVVELQPLVTVPAEAATPPLARVLYATPTPDATGRLLINDINGVLYQTSQTGAAPTPYLDLRTQGIGFVAGIDPASPGFNGFALHPNFNGDLTKPGYGKFYTTSFTTNDGTGLTFAGNSAGSQAVSIREWTTATPGVGSFSGTSREVMRLAGYTDGHSNGMIAFNTTTKPGSADYGNLYIGNGDGDYNDPAFNAQNMKSPLGKMLRINPLQTAGGAPYSVPSDNPFVGTATTLPEIWASGLRNPQSFTWDAGGSHTMYINDIGQAVIEEVNIGRAGANYGWPYREGSFATGYTIGVNDENIYALPANDASSGFSCPVAQYDHSQGNAIGSGILYRGAAIPALDGMYVMADIVSGRMYYFDPATSSGCGKSPLHELIVEQGGVAINLRDTFGYDSFLVSPRVDARLSEDANGEPLLLLKANGEVFRLGAGQTVPEPGSGEVLVGALVGLLVLRRVAQVGKE